LLLILDELVLAGRAGSEFTEEKILLASQPMSSVDLFWGKE